jgi:hypothetical protein
VRYKIVITTGENQETITWTEADSLAQAREQVRVEVTPQPPEDALSNLRRLRAERYNNGQDNE